MGPLLGRVIGIVAGLAAAVVAVGLVEAVSATFYPLPEGIDPRDRAGMTAAIAALPAGAFVGVLAAWGLGAFAGAWTATRLARLPPIGYLIGVLLAGAALANLLTIPHPVWVWAGAAVVIPAGTIAGVRLALARLARTSEQ